MAVKKILKIEKHEKFLRTPSEPVKKINREIRQLIEDIRDTIDANPAVGLAAPQIGVHKRLFGARMSYEQDQPEEAMQPPMIFINPELLEVSDDVERDFDACLSIPGMMGYTDRNIKIKVRYQDEKGKWIVQDFEGWDARVIQHETDHLNGVLFLDRLESLEDLFVMVAGEDGEAKPVPYLEIKQAAQRSGSDKTQVPILDKGARRELAEAKAGMDETPPKP
jgi:peptide deformylase